MLESLERGHFDALVATSPENIAYITRFRSRANAVVPSQAFGIFTSRGVALVVPIGDISTLVADSVDVDQVVCFGRSLDSSQDSPDAEAQWRNALGAELAADPAQGLALALDRLGIHGGALGLEESGLTHDTWVRVTDHLLHAKVTPAAFHLAEARRVKGPYEIECLGHALRIAEASLDAVIQTVDRGMTAHDAATFFAVEVIKRGGWPRPPLVGVGEHSGILSPSPGDAALRPGDLIRFDVGCTYKGYHSSVARTAVLGPPLARHESAYRAIRTGLEEATSAIAAGVTAAHVFDRAEEAFRESGLPRFEGDHVGYGIGLEPRERPELARGSGTLLALGEVLRVEATHVTISSMGVSAADTVLVTSAGARVLNRSHHGLIVLD